MRAECLLLHRLLFVQLTFCRLEFVCRIEQEKCVALSTDSISVLGLLLVIFQRTKAIDSIPIRTSNRKRRISFRSCLQITGQHRDNSLKMPSYGLGSLILSWAQTCTEIHEFIIFGKEMCITREWCGTFSNWSMEMLAYVKKKKSPKKNTLRVWREITNSNIIRYTFRGLRPFHNGRKPDSVLSPPLTLCLYTLFLKLSFTCWKH